MMKIYILIIFTVFAVVQSSAQCNKSKNNVKNNKTMTVEEVEYKDLPDGAKLTDEIRVNKYNDEGIIISFETISVKEKLTEIGAKYLDGKLVDQNEREIRFYKPPIRGASQGFEEDEKERKSDEKKLAELKEKFTVIEIYINPLKIM